jgi:hypothetical protein
MSYKKLYLLEEFGKRFYIRTTSLEQAKIEAELWGSKVILDEALPEEYKFINPESISIVDGKIFKAVGKIN